MKNDITFAYVEKDRLRRGKVCGKCGKSARKLTVQFSANRSSPGDGQKEPLCDSCWRALVKAVIEKMRRKTEG